MPALDTTLLYETKTTDTDEGVLTRKQRMENDEKLQQAVVDDWINEFKLESDQNQQRQPPKSVRFDI